MIRNKVVSGLTVTKACGYLGISRQALYQRYNRQMLQLEHETLVLQQVRNERRTHPRIGGRKLKYLLSLRSMYIGRDNLFNLLREHRLLVRPKRAYHKTTNSHHRFHCHPNIIKNGFIPSSPEQLWVADITYFPTQEGESYVSLVTDAYSRKVVGYQVDSNMKTSSVKKAFTNALKQRCRTTNLIHHSDKGVQYCSGEYQQLHIKHNVQCSMTDGYDCYQNALAERINGILKSEYLLCKPKNLEEAKKMVGESVTNYNERRPHSALKYKTPDEVHRAL